MNFVLAPVPDAEGYVALARTPKGRLFRKHILTKGTLLHPVTGKPITVDDQFFATLTKNFNENVCDIVQVPRAGANNEHTEDPKNNLGEVVGVETQGDKLYALIDAREDADKFGKTYLGASAMMHMNYPDTRTGKKAGPTLLHVCVTNRPYVTGLEDYQELVAASADGVGEELVMLTAAPSVTGTKEKTMDLAEMLATLQLEHGIDVKALQAQAAVATQLTNALGESGLLKLTAGEQASVEDVVGAVAELNSNNVALSNRVESLEKAAVVNEVDGLIGEGRILPAQRDTYIELRLTNPEMFSKLVPEKPLVALSHELGTEPKKGGQEEADLDAEITRLTSVAAEAGHLVKS